MGLNGLGGLGSSNESQQPQEQTAGLGGLGGLGEGMQTPAQQVNLSRAVDEKVSLKKGQKVSLKKMATDAGVNGGALSKVKVGLGWDLNKYDGGHDFDLDVFTFAVKGDGKVRNSGDFIFFNNMRLSNGSVELMGDNRTGAGSGDDEVVEVDLNTVPAEIEKIIFTIIINEAQVRRQNFGMVGNAFVRLVDTNTNKEFLRYDLSEDYSIETAVVVGEIYRHKGEWKFTAIGSGFNDGLPALCACYGVDAE